ncbi:MAG TPA: hypothetical protein VKT82_08460 [Ktedonobacterales bacterium]|nr:hypothetical protein [Ktedonobacterales bacterium]
MATKTKQTPFERALSRAEKDGVRVVKDFGDLWQVRGSDGVTRYTVQTTGNGLHCTCPSRHYCKHLAVCQQRLNERQAESEQLAAEAGKALILAEQSERTLAGQIFSQEERLKALVCLPVAIAAYAVIMGSAHARQWHQAKEEQWDKYQTARLTGSLSW